MLLSADREKGIRKSAQQAFICYIEMTRTNAYIYHDRFTVLLVDTQSLDEYVGGFFVLASTDIRSFYLDNAETDEERGVAPLQQKAMMTLLTFFHHMGLFCFLPCIFLFLSYFAIKSLFFHDLALLLIDTG